MPAPDDFPDNEIVAETYLHIIFWTGKLAPMLSPAMLACAREEMDEALFAVEGEALAAGGTENHLHVLARQSPNHSVRESLDAMRRRLTAWTAKADGTKRVWHEDEVAVTIGPEDLNKARRFIAGQRAHHEIVSFQSELKAIFDEHGFDYDERELWG